MTAADRRPRTPKQRVSAVAAGAAWLVGLSAALTLADGVLGSVPVARGVLGGLFVTIAVGRAGILWDDDDPDSDSYRWPAILGLRGAARGAAIALVTIVIAVAAGWASVGPSAPTLSLLVGLVVAAGAAVRDELLLRALPIHFARRAGLVGRSVGGRVSVATPTELGVVGFTALLSVAPLGLSPQASPAALVLTASIGFLHGAMQLRTRSAWGPIASNFVLRLLLGPTLQSGVLHMEWKVGELSMGTLASGPSAWIFAALAVAVALVGLPARPPPPPDPLSVDPAARPRGPRRSPRTPRPRPAADRPSAPPPLDEELPP